MKETFHFSDVLDFNRSKTFEPRVHARETPRLAGGGGRGLLLLQGIREKIHLSGRGRVRGGTQIAGGEGWLGHKGSALPKELTAGSLGSAVFIPPGRTCFPHPCAHLMGRKRLFLRLGTLSN